MPKSKSNANTNCKINIFSQLLHFPQMDLRKHKHDLWLQQLVFSPTGFFSYYLLLSVGHVVFVLCVISDNYFSFDQSDKLIISLMKIMNNAYLV